MIDKKKQGKGKVVRVSFELPKEAASKSVSVVGDFNEWDPEVHPMKLLKKGTWKREVYLESGRSYYFRYFVDGQDWLNDEAADRYVPNQYGGEDCVIDL